MSAPWLVVIDPQAIFAAPESEWASPFFADVMPRIWQLAAEFDDRVVVTRWLPTGDRSSSWGEYLRQWPFADRPLDDAMFQIVPDAEGLSSRASVDLSTFGKWGPQLQAITGPAPHLVLVGVSTDCCVLSTALAAADAGAFVTVVTDACAGSSEENHRAAVQVMGLYPPQIALATTAEVLAEVT